jgi:hypothetical protein
MDTPFWETNDFDVEYNGVGLSARTTDNITKQKHSVDGIQYV